jgi:hypothetical protein
MVEVNHNYVVLGVQTDDLVVSGKYGNADVQGILTGSVIVMGPAKFAVNGIMHGDLLIKEGATVEIRGTLDAPVIQARGRLDVYGTVECPLGVPDTAVLHPGCVVNGVKRD